jgi:hypothetical protein
MNLFIYIEITDFLNINYKKSLHHWIKQNVPSFSTFDFNNFSDINAISSAIHLVRDAENIVILVEFKDKIQPGSTLRFIESLSRQKEKNFYFILNGENPLIEKMLKSIENLKFYQSLDEEGQKELLIGIHQQNS